MSRIGLVVLLASALAGVGCGGDDSAEAIARHLEDQADALEDPIAFPPPSRDATPQQRNRAVVIGTWLGACERMKTRCFTEVSRCGACVKQKQGDCDLVCNAAKAICDGATRCYDGLERWTRNP